MPGLVYKTFRKSRGHRRVAGKTRNQEAGLWSIT